ncbi:thioesterase family protein [Solicola gregarius]|uniref:Thioesterase family protein n=1 Tax=Solicola gregarius TaxID=2908642 RepID=A0AA46TKL8_9ACTN|nr:thioesterase family protein [Solicola gregarius]UYM06830.1 thioesterase family protein [Solicola gregarius]
MSYFERTGASTYRATSNVSGAWDPADQHIAPALGLLAHVVEMDRDRRGRDDLVIGRLSYDILGTVPVEEMETSVEVLRPGRTIELVEAVLRHNNRDVVRMRVWLLQPRDTADLAGTALPRIPSPDDTPAWDPATVWPGGFIGSVEVRRAQVEPGRAAFWVRTTQPLVDDEKASRLAAAVGLLDIANGMTVRADPKAVVFPNVDLTAHLFAEPQGDWLGFDTTVSFGTSGLGTTSTVIHDAGGPIGTMTQMLTVRPR